MLKIIWPNEYLKYDFGKSHPFWVERGQAFLKKIAQEKKFSYQVLAPKKAKDEDILLVHSKNYLNRVKELALSKGNLSSDTPLNEKILQASYWYVGGTILALEEVLKGNTAMNLLGGLHHAGSDNSSGFCVFNDHAIAIKKLQKMRELSPHGKIWLHGRKVFILDIDVHAGNGTQEIFYQDSTVFTVSLHQDPRTLYPGIGFENETGASRGKGFNRNFVLAPGATGGQYLKKFHQALELIPKFKPDLLILIFGADTYKEDPLANINLELNDYFKIGHALKPFQPFAILCAGGYSKKVPEIWLKFLQGLLD